MRKIEDLLKLGPNDKVSPAENAALIAHFSKKPEKTTVLGTIYLATKGKVLETAESIQEAAERQQARDKVTNELNETIKELSAQLKAQKGLKS